MQKGNAQQVLDAGFGTDGRVFTDFGLSGENAGQMLINAAAIQSDGKIVVAGNGGGGANLGLARYNSDGSPDNSFGYQGRAGFSIGYYNSSIVLPSAANDVKILPDGKILTLCNASIYSTPYRDDCLILRWNSNGTLDTSFGIGGMSQFDLNHPCEASRGLAVQNDGKIIAVGGTDVIRYNSDGSPDTTFGSNGRVFTRINPYDRTKAVYVRSDGKILVGGTYDGGYPRFLFFLYNTNGTLDTSFGTGGRSVKGTVGGETDADEFGAFTLLSDGKILVGGSAYATQTNSNMADFAVARYFGDGNPDTTFGTGGKTRTSFGGNVYVNALALQSDGKIVLAGTRENGSGGKVFALARYNPDGTIDPSFGVNGITTTDGGGQNEAFAVLAQSNGTIIAAGQGSTPSPTFTMACYNGDGSLDTNFASGGLSKLIFAHGGDRSTAVVTTTDNKIVVAGNSSDGSLGSRISVARYSSNGSPDTSFGTNGQVLVNFPAAYASAVAVQSDGKIVIGGTSGQLQKVTLVRLNTNGTLDTSFNSSGTVTFYIPYSFEPHVRDIRFTSGKILVAGNVKDSNGTYGNLFQVRFNSDGTPDTTFGTNGQVMTLFGTPYITKVSFQSDGKVIVLAPFQIGRYNSDGSLDTSFGTNGLLSLENPGTFTTGADVLFTPDGKILVSGTTQSSDPYVRNDTVVARYNADGTLDTTFAATGAATVSFNNSHSNGRTLNLQSDGKILITANSVYHFNVARFNNDGTLDTSFGISGTSSALMGPNSTGGPQIAQSVLQSSGLLVVGQAPNAGSASLDYALARFLVQQPPPTTVSIGDASVSEPFSGQANVTFAVTISKSPTSTVTVNYATANGTATAGTDYVATSGTLTFAANTSTLTQTVTVPVKADTVTEGNETFFVNLTSPVNVTLGDAQGLGTIKPPVDTVVPSVAITVPTNNTTVYNSLPAISGTATDADSGVAKVELRLYRLTSTTGVYEYWNGTAWIIPATGATIPQIGTTLSPAAGGSNTTWIKNTGLPTGANLADGTYYVRAYATDKGSKVGGSGTITIKKLTDATAPTVSFTSSVTTPVGTTPINGSTIYNALPVLTGLAADAGSGVAKVELRLSRPTATAGVDEYWNGSSWIVPAAGTTIPQLSTTLNLTTGGANITWSKTTGLPTSATLTDGTYYLRAYATDKAGKSGGSTLISFKKLTDGTAPTVSFTTATTSPIGTTPANGATIYNTLPAITGVAADNLAVAKVELRFYRLTATAGVYEYWNGTSWFTPGAGDATPQLLTTLSPSNGGPNVTWSKSSGWPLGTNFADNTYYLRAYATDRAAKSTGSATFSFKKITDATAPTISFTTSTTTPIGTTPLNSSTIYNTLPAITGIAADNLTVAKVELRLYRLTATAGVYEYWNGTAWITPATGATTPQLVATLTPTAGGANITWTKSIGLPTGTNLPDSTYYLRAYAYDRAGKSAGTAQFSFKKFNDLSAPSVSIATPASNQQMAINAFGAGTISGSATDNLGVVTVKLRLQRKRGTTTTYWNGTAFTTAVATVDATVTKVGGTAVTWRLDKQLPTSTTLDVGAYSVYATTNDAAGNTVTSSVRSFALTTSTGSDVVLDDSTSSSSIFADTVSAGGS